VAPTVRSEVIPHDPKRSDAKGTYIFTALEAPREEKKERRCLSLRPLIIGVPN